MYYTIHLQYFHSSLWKIQTVSFASGKMENIGRMENIVVLPLSSKSPVKLIYWIALGSALRACSLLKSVSIIL